MEKPSRQRDLVSHCSFPAAPEFVNSIINVANKKRPDLQIENFKGISSSKGCVDLEFPKHVRLSSTKNIVSEIQDEMRRDIVFRHSLPERFSRENLTILEKVYSPNRQIK